MRQLSLSLLIIALALQAGCASAPRSGASPSIGGDVITEAELRTLSVSSAYEAIERLRPAWLRRGSARSVNLSTEVAVVQNGSYFGPLETLRTIPAVAITEIRFLDGPSAVSEVPGILRGGRHVEAAILLRTGRP